MDPRLPAPFYAVHFDPRAPYWALGIPSNSFHGYSLNEVRAALQMGLHVTHTDVEDPSEASTYELFKGNISSELFPPDSRGFFLRANELVKQARDRIRTLLGVENYEALEASQAPFKFFRLLLSVHSDVLEAIPEEFRDCRLDNDPHGEHIRLQNLPTDEHVLRVKTRSMGSLVLKADTVLTRIAQNL